MSGTFWSATRITIKVMQMFKNLWQTRRWRWYYMLWKVTRLKRFGLIAGYLDPAIQKELREFAEQVLAIAAADANLYSEEMRE